jgi:hypothetical protein
MRLRAAPGLHSADCLDRLWRWRSTSASADADVYNSSRHLHAHRARSYWRRNRFATAHAYCPLIIASGSGEEDRSSPRPILQSSI